MNAWLEVQRGSVPLIVSFPHTGTELPEEIEGQLLSAERALCDTDWWVHELYDMASALQATTIRTRMSRTVIDVNRDPSGASLYPGQATTELCPLTTFDGEPLYHEGSAPSEVQIGQRRAQFFDPYHAALASEIERLRSRHGQVVLYDAHSIRSRIPRLFDGQLPHFNIGTHGGRSCDPLLTADIERICDASAFSRVTNGRFRGGWTTRHYGEPKRGVHAVQMELACRGYLEEPETVADNNWPPAYDRRRAATMQGTLSQVLGACLAFAQPVPRRA